MFLPYFVELFCNNPIVNLKKYRFFRDGTSSSVVTVVKRYYSYPQKMSYDAEFHGLSDDIWLLGTFSNNGCDKAKI